MALSKQNYIAIGKILALHEPDRNFAFMVKESARYFKKENAKFDKDKFIEYVKELQREAARRR